jgi:2-polyprenyl-6-methoxyphenol hydroxylase-like FAD-dependent oxidoreductase
MTAAGRSLHVVIVGAGIGGLAAAAALRLVGAQVEVHEKARALARVGAGLQLAPNATSALRGLGLLAQVRAMATRPESWCSFSGDDGALTLRLPLGDEVESRFGSPYLHVHRSDLHDVLLEAIGDVRLGHCAVGVEQHLAGVTVTFADGCAVTADLVIGADGVHSTVREVLFGALPARFSGLVAYRGIVPADRLPDIPLISAKWWGPDRHLVHYWVSQGRELNLVAPVPEPTWTEETWTGEGKVADLLDALSGFAAPVRRVAAAATTLMRSALYDRDPLPRWGEGRMTLLGDACHPMLPFMAQGAGMAIEDAVILARCLDRVPSDGVEEALARYAATRLARTSAVQGGSRANDFLRGTSSGLSSEDVYSYDAWRVPLAL